MHFKGRMHSASLLAGALQQYAHDASRRTTARQSTLMLPHDLSICICALQLKRSEGRPNFGKCCLHGKVKLLPPT